MLPGPTDSPDCTVTTAGSIGAPCVGSVNVTRTGFPANEDEHRERGQRAQPFRNLASLHDFSPSSL
jgi:hypothetical protein